MPVAADDVRVIPHHPTRIYRVAILRGGSLPLRGIGPGAWQIFWLFLIFFLIYKNSQTYTKVEKD